MTPKGAMASATSRDVDVDVPGRGAKPAQVVAVRLTETELRSLDGVAAREHISRSEAIRRAIAQLST